MIFKFLIPTEVRFGKDCIMESKGELSKFGRKALIVTGKNSARASGALTDMENAMKEAGISYEIYDSTENNPSLENVKDGGRKAFYYKADFIAGIGGGSVLDAAKAIAVLAANDMDPNELFKNRFNVKPLPVIAVPTTAGTGSEVTQYSILTRHDMQTKMSFGNEDTFPRIALIDPQYTSSMPYEVTVNTAVDALSHAVEGYLGRRSTCMSEVFAIKAVEVFGDCIGSLIENRIDYSIREKLMFASMLGGMVIAHTGTTVVHGMGYSLTYFKGIPHGKANGLLMAEYLRFNRAAVGDKIDKILELLKIKDLNELEEILRRLLPCRISLSDEELELYACLTMKQRSTLNTAKSVAKEDIVKIMRSSLE